MMTILRYFDEISIILSYALFLWWVYMQFNVDGFGPWVWDGGNGYVVSCLGFFYSVPLVVGYLFLFCCIPGCLLRSWCVHGPICRFAPHSENKKNSLCEVVWLRYDISI